MLVPLGVAIIAIFLTLMWTLNRLRIKQKNSDLYVLITGCDTGFGHLAAKSFASRGINVFAGYLKEFDAGAEPSRNITPIQLDITKEENIREAVRTISNRLPAKQGLWAVINNAGISTHTGLSEAQTVDNFNNCMAVNLYGPVLVVKHLLPLLRKSSGRIVNVASVAGKFAFPFSAPYVVSKYAIEGYSECLRRELYLQGISVHVVEPGVFETGMLNRAKPAEFSQKSFDTLPDDVKDYYGRDYIEKLSKGLSRYQGSSDLTLVTEAYYHAVTARYPRAHYRVGWGVFHLLINLPTGVTDYLLSRNQIKPAGAS
uniref:17-beta-hydroxysteroid dehydrogenase type 6-like n=1 Tax=Crassostrea virginica TaxID=6565 RepID=A0A8B8C0U3_CRAVI|nr:17-beta-hydroxysteroid dehydrogenase type 6-like [Crassostrea virginica]XP_022308718.1 17-beta-hydroxysteroid dehydrogenase type 6-like [Crassostrea virginica]XP_022308719.1 17-beta-hydroxysteroid dehydrogenase type 6-like [Crassostrea virginica]